jgi:hypothetical protein
VAQPFWLPSKKQLKLGNIPIFSYGPTLGTEASIPQFLSARDVSVFLKSTWWYGSFSHTKLGWHTHFDNPVISG